LAFIVRRHDGTSFIGRPRELDSLPIETLLGLLVEDGAGPVSFRVRDHALDTVRFIDARFRTSIVVRVCFPQNLLSGSEAALWFGLQGVATPKKVELAQTLAHAVSIWLSSYTPVIRSLKAAHERQVDLQERLAEMISIAHDARAPLGSLQYLLSDLEAIYPEVQRDAVRLRRELQYVDALLATFSPRETRQARSLAEDTDVCSVVQRVCQRFAQEVASHGGAFDLVLPVGTSVMVRAPELDVERIVSNIVGNAVRYAGMAKIRIEITRGKPGKVRLSVSDCGPGFPSSVIDALQMGARREVRGAGTTGWGVGLISSKRQLHALGGDLTVESSASGSMVAITLVAAECIDSSGKGLYAAVTNRLGTEALSVEEPLSGGGEPNESRIEPELVIIDDDTDHSESLERVLRRANISSRSFSTVVDAIAYIKDVPCGRVVCDAHMPDGGAEKLLSVIKALGRAVPCAVMSGETSDDALYRFAALGAREFFAKPASIERLVAWARG
jgi:signal transduction histidine kinase/CheY-like chemotaxis protein